MSPQDPSAGGSNPWAAPSGSPWAAPESPWAQPSAPAAEPTGRVATGGPGTPGEPPERPARRRRGLLAAGLTGGVVGALVAGAVSYGVVQATDDDEPAQAVPVEVQGEPTRPEPLAGDGSVDEADVKAILDKVGPSVVSIEVGGRFGRGAGSGVIISADGLVLTNAHVVEGADAIRVRFGDGDREDATLVGSSARNDIALIRITGASGLTPAVLGDSDALEVGDEVVAIGNALDLGDSLTVTRGIVSAKGRSLDAGEVQLENLIQTDAAINRGNSGGPLVNAAGEVIGINSAGIPDAQNLGFAIEINAVKPLIERLQTGQPVVETVAFLGVASQDVSQFTAAELEELGVTAEEGAVVVEVTPNSGADDAGLQVGDVITGIDGEQVTGSSELRAAIQQRQPGAEVTLEVQRGDGQREITATLGSRQITDN